MERIRIQDLSLWEAFYWVSKSGTFTAAAKQLRVSLPRLSKKVTLLEQELGTRLFNRTTRSVSMTHEAALLLPGVEQLLENAGSLERAKGAQEESGTIRLTCIPAFAQRCLAPMLVKFQKLHPGVHFDLHVSDAVVDMVEMQMDLAIRVQKPRGAQFVFRKLCTNDLVWCASPKYLAAHAIPRKPKDLNKHVLLTLSVYNECRVGARGPRIKDMLKNNPILCESGAVLTELALQGGGIALRSRWDVKRYFENGSLVPVLEKFPVDAFGEVYAVTPHSRFLTRRVRMFLDFLVSECRQLEG
jgi:LysR family transcriptional regulator, transcriptional activator for dmlA